MFATQELPLLTPKRRGSDTGPDSLYPYYAGFSSRFAQATLTALHLAPGSVVLDPWVGSGTTLVAAADQGHSAIGVDMNPFAAMLASAKALERKDIRLVRGLGQKVSVAVRGGKSGPKNAFEPLALWFSARGAERLRGAWAALSELSGGAAINAVHESRAASFVGLALVIAARQFIGDTTTSNPTWSRPGRRKPFSSERFEQAFLHTLDDLLARAHFIERGNISVLLGDARKLPFTDASIDAVLTSPPYCTRIDYAVTTQFELALMGGVSSEEFTRLRREMMGTTSLRSERGLGVLPEEIGSLLERIRKHPSHRSEAYYFRNLAQYFRDAYAALSQIRRVLRPQGRAVFVLQTSYYKEIEIDLPTLFSTMAEHLGMTAHLAAEIPVARVMTSINTQSRRYAAQRRYRESVLVITQSDEGTISARDGRKDEAESPA